VVTGYEERFRNGAWTALVVLALLGRPLEAQPRLAGRFAVEVGAFAMDVPARYTRKEGLPSDSILSIAVSDDQIVWVGTSSGLIRFREGRWQSVATRSGPVSALAAVGNGVCAVVGGILHVGNGERLQAVGRVPVRSASGPYALATDGDAVYLGTPEGLFRLEDGEWFAESALSKLMGEKNEIRQIAVGSDGRLAVAAQSGLFFRSSDGGEWRALFPRQGHRSWAPYDVRGVAFDDKDRLWFASPQGVGRFDGREWALFSGEDGLPYNDFTWVAAKGPRVWFGTHIGAIAWKDGVWSYRQGRQWLPSDDVRAVAVSAKGDAWFATDAGVGRIAAESVTLKEKARRFEEAIDRFHRRTPYGYVLSVRLAQPGDLSRWSQHDSDNDGLWTSMYGAGECFAYAATGDSKAKKRATKAFEAVAFLSEVTQGGSHPAPPGFPARSILPASGPNPNDSHTPEHDRASRKRDPLWKVMEPRWPTSADGKWYWKCDTSSDELDGHYFLYAAYYDLVAETEAEKARVREVVLRITDHLIDHGFQLIDHDGRPTRWARFSPRDLNGGLYWAERGLNSLSMLSYLKVAEHVSGGASKYRQAYRALIEKHSYDTNVMDPKVQHGVGTGNQSDDEMALMSFYNLLKYETDPHLRRKYMLGLARYWTLVKPERCPLFNFIVAASFDPKSIELLEEAGKGVQQSVGEGIEEAVWTLQRFPLQRVRWGFRNSHRLDIVRFAPSLLNGPGRGALRNGKALPIDERFVEHWNHDPWRLDEGGDGRQLADGASFLLPYYMGLHHGFIVERHR